MIDEIVQHIEQLPPIPDVISQLQSHYYYDDYNVADIEKILKRDPNLVANILKRANSPYYGLPREFVDLRQAIAYFGLEQIIEFALATMLDELVRIDLRFYHMTPQQFMQMSQKKSLVAQRLSASKIDRLISANAAFLCDVSKVVISAYATKKGIELADEDEALNELDEKECELLGFDTIEVSVAMFERWNFDEALIELLQSFKKCENERQKALFVAREVVTRKGNVDKERAQEYPQLQHLE